MQAKLNALQAQNSLEMSQIQQGISYVLTKSGDERDQLSGELKTLEAKLQQQQDRIDEQNKLVHQLDQLSTQVLNQQKSQQNKIQTLYQTTTQLVENQQDTEQDTAQVVQLVNQIKQECGQLNDRFDMIQSSMGAIVESQTGRAGQADAGARPQPGDLGLSAAQ